MRKLPEKVETFKGKTINYLTLLELAEPSYTIYKNKKIKKSNWLCKCVCGNEKIISHGNLTSGSIKSCGCKRKEIIKEAIQTYYKAKYLNPVENRLYGNYAHHLNDEKRKFNLDKDYFISLVNSNCYYCGISPFLIRGNKNKTTIKALNGIDRLNSSKGYEKGNVVPCCVHCNRAKMDRSEEDFKKWIILVYNNLYTDERGRN